MKREFFFKILFVYLFVKEREHTQASRVAGRGREKSRLPAQQGAHCRTRSHDPGIRAWVKGSSLTNWVTQESWVQLFLKLGSTPRLLSNMNQSIPWLQHNCVGLSVTCNRNVLFNYFFKASSMPNVGLNSQPWYQESRAPGTEPAMRPVTDVTEVLDISWCEPGLGKRVASFGAVVVV